MRHLLRGYTSGLSNRLSLMLAIACLGIVFTSPVQAEGWWSRMFTSQPPDPTLPAGGRPTEQRSDSSEPTGGHPTEQSFCAIAPIETLPTSVPPLVSSDRLLLVWLGELEAIELWQLGEEDPLWSKTITSDDQINQLQLESGETAFYITVEVELQPDKQYEWRVKEPLFTPISIRFTVLSEEQQIAIQQDFPDTTVITEAEAIDRADYFAHQQLWSEFWREVLAIEQPSNQLKQAIDEAVNWLCS